MRRRCYGATGPYERRQTRLYPLLRPGILPACRGWHIHKKGAIKTVMKCLRNNEIIGLLIDQKTSARYGTEIEFFGQPTMGLTTSAMLQLHLDVWILPMFMVRTGRGRYKLIVKPPVTSETQAKDKSERLTELTQRHQSIIEDVTYSKRPGRGRISSCFSACFMSLDMQMSSASLFKM